MQSGKRTNMSESKTENTKKNNIQRADDPQRGMKTQTVQTLDAFIRVIDSIKPSALGTLWFRGQSSASHRLIPGVLRDITQTRDWAGRPVKRGAIQFSGGGTVSGLRAEAMLEAFKRQARPFLEHPPSNDFEWMFIAQHHGLPTRLLDWSTNALVALYFAASGAEQRSGDGTSECNDFNENPFSDEGFSVFAIDPIQINEKVFGLSEPLDISANLEHWSNYIDPMASEGNNLLPICVTAPHMTTRIRAQSGSFTLHGANVYPLDYYTDLQPLITKIFIPYTSTGLIINSLQKVGITESFIYPGLDTIARDITRSERTSYATRMEQYFNEES